MAKTHKSNDFVTGKYNPEEYCYIAKHSKEHYSANGIMQSKKNGYRELTLLCKKVFARANLKINKVVYRNIQHKLITLTLPANKNDISNAFDLVFSRNWQAFRGGDGDGSFTIDFDIYERYSQTYCVMCRFTQKIECVRRFGMFDGHNIQDNPRAYAPQII